MDKLPYHLLWFGIVLVVIFVVYFFLLRFKLKRKKYQSIGEFSYLIKKFHLDTRKIDYWKLIIPVSFINAFIISFVSTFVMLIPVHMMLRMLIGFVLLFALIYSLYEIYGRHLVKKYGKD